MLEPKNLQRRIRLIKAYGEAYRAFMVAKKADKPVEEQILHELRDYEEGLTVEDIILFRDISENKHSAFTESAEGTEGAQLAAENARHRSTRWFFGFRSDRTREKLVNVL